MIRTCDLLVGAIFSSTILVGLFNGEFFQLLNAAYQMFKETWRETEGDLQMALATLRERAESRTKRNRRLTILRPRGFPPVAAGVSVAQRISGASTAIDSTTADLWFRVNHLEISGWEGFAELNVSLGVSNPQLDSHINIWSVSTGLAFPTQYWLNPRVSVGVGRRSPADTQPDRQAGSRWGARIGVGADIPTSSPVRSRFDYRWNVFSNAASHELLAGFGVRWN